MRSGGDQHRKEVKATSPLPILHWAALEPAAQDFSATKPIPPEQSLTPKIHGGEICLYYKYL